MVEPDTAEVTTALQAQVNELQLEIDALRSRRQRHHRLRDVLTWIAAVLAVLLIVVAVIGIWARSTLLDSDNFAATVSPLPQNEVVSGALATVVSRDIVQAVGVEQIVEENFPNATFLAAPVAAAVADVLRQPIQAFIRSDRFDQLWTEAARLAHQGVLRFLRDEGTGLVEIDQGQVAIDLLPAVVAIIDSLEGRLSELLPSDVQLPEVSADDADQAIQELNERFDLDLPEDFGTFVVYDNDAVTTVQDALAFFDRFTILAVVVAVVMTGIAIALARDRRRVIMILSLGVVALLLLLWVVLDPIRAEVLAAVDEGTPRDVANATMQIVFRGLRDDLRNLLVVAVLAVAVTFFIGPHPWARRTRSAVAEGVAHIGDRQPVMDPDAPFALWVQRNRAALVAAGFIVAFAILVLVDRVTWGSLGVVLVLLAVWELAVALLARRPAEDDEEGEEAEEAAAVAAGEVQAELEGAADAALEAAPVSGEGQPQTEEGVPSAKE